MQDFIDYFRNDAVELPLVRKPDEHDFRKFVIDKFTTYTNFIDSLPASRFNTAVKDRIDKIKSLGAFIYQAIGKYYAGLPHVAYQSLHNAIEPVKMNFQQLKYPADKIDQLYRIRVARPDEWHLKKEDLFHIPFDERKKVSSRRYSIPGLPCLYMGGSLYICWLEMDRPSFDSIFMARFKTAPGQEINIINMGTRPKHLANFIEREKARGVTSLWHGESYLLAYAVCWPLIAACSIRRPPADRDAHFVSEYIIPQLLLQWVITQLDLDGICYFSVRTEATSEPSYGIANFVFPARDVAPTGFCTSLASKFEMTFPVPWQILASEQNTSFSLSQNERMEIELIPNEPGVYWQSMFGKMENKLLAKDCEPMVFPTA